MEISSQVFLTLQQAGKFTAKHNNQGNNGWAAAFENFLVL